MYVCHYLCIYTCISSYLHKCIDAYSMHRVWWRFWLENRSEIDPKTVPNRSQIGPKSVQNRSKIGFGTDLAANIDFGPFWSRFRTVLGPLLAASWRPLGGQVGVKLVQKSIFGGPGWRSKTNMMLDTFLNRFLVDFGTILGSKIDPKSVQNRSQERS